MDSLYQSIRGRTNATHCLDGNVFFITGVFCSAAYRYSLGVIATPDLVCIYREKSLKIQQSLVSQLFSCWAQLQIWASFCTDCSSIAPTELYSTTLLNRTVTRKIFPSQVLSCSHDPNPSVSMIQTLTPLNGIGWLHIRIPFVHEPVLPLTQNPVVGKSEFSKKDFPLRQSPHTLTKQLFSWGWSRATASGFSSNSEWETVYARLFPGKLGRSVCPAQSDSKCIMEKRVYQFIVFVDKEIIYYMDPQEANVDYLALQKEHRFQNIYSASEMLSNVTKQLHPGPNTHPRNFRTQEYQFSLFETANGVKMILVTSLRHDNTADVALQSLFDLYISLVKKNYMYNPNEIVRVKRFDQEVRKVLKTLE